MNPGPPARSPTDPGLVITCEHGGNRIPRAYRPLFADQLAVLDSHRGFDPGALEMAEELALAFAAPLVASTTSRLLVDLNRSIGNPALHAAQVRRLSAEQREDILARHYRPFRNRAEQAVRRTIAENGAVLHLSSHSFTPELDGKTRLADIGLLYDPRRPGECALCRRWQAALASAAPHLSVRRNYPYAGKGDGLTRWLRQRLPPDIYVGVELEVNQRHVLEAGPQWPALRQLLVTTLRHALSQPQAGLPALRAASNHSTTPRGSTP
ncbi:N-formylglutamate amidohydrolase [Zoogloea sp.]|uniref:N-formylglutamate amidohydrolase n=1 Tax=Zoogloea sp. TaxID=49181 RepID=UPI0031FDB368